MTYRDDYRKIQKAMKAATAGLKRVAVTIEVETMDELKSRLADHGYMKVVGLKAYRNVNAIGTSDFLKIKETDDGYSVKFTTWTRR